MGRPGIAATGALLGALGAALYLAVLTGSPGALILVYLAQLPLFAAGLWLGVAAAAAAALTASMVLLAAGGMVAAMLFAGLYAAPVVLLVRQALLARQRTGRRHRMVSAGNADSMADRARSRGVCCGAAALRRPERRRGFAARELWRRRSTASSTKATPAAMR